MQKQKDSYEDVIERSNKLRERKEEISQGVTQDDIQDSAGSTLNNRQFVTGLISGEIIDVSYCDGHFSKSVMLDVKTSSSEVIEVSVEDSGQYSEDNELVRLLEWKDVPEARIDDLIGEKITLQSENAYQRKSEEIDNIRWDVYVPKDLDVAGTAHFRTDNVLRRAGLQNYEDYMSDDDPVFIKLMVLGLAGCVTVLSLLISSILLFWIQSTIVFLTILFVINFYLPAIANYAYEGLDRYKEYRKSDAVRRNLKK
jgi:hypothetical protein